jgi:hypothetical protein
MIRAVKEKFSIELISEVRFFGKCRQKKPGKSRAF